jgi:hypothetical protein
VTKRRDAPGWEVVRLPAASFNFFPQSADFRRETDGSDGRDTLFGENSSFIKALDWTFEEGILLASRIFADLRSFFNDCNQSALLDEAVVTL